MNAREQGFLLLTSHLGNVKRRTLTIPQLRILATRVRAMEIPNEDRQLNTDDLLSLGYSEEFAQRIYSLLSDTDMLEAYCKMARRSGCYPLSRVSEQYPQRLRVRLGLESPGCLWAKGDVSLLQRPAIALVGSRDMNEKNLAFAQKVGYQAAQRGYVLVSGNARGADRAAQDACLASGGQVISVVADRLDHCVADENILYLSEDGYELDFSAQRALSRNRVIHALADGVFVAQCVYGSGGTWDGTMKNLLNLWTPVFCFDDGSDGTQALSQHGAQLIGCDALADIETLLLQKNTLF